MKIFIKSPLGGGQERMNHGFAKEHVGTNKSWFTVHILISKNGYV